VEDVDVDCAVCHQSNKRKLLLLLLLLLTYLCELRTGMSILLTLSVYQISVRDQLPKKSGAIPLIG